MPRYFKVFNGSRRYVKSQGGWDDTPAVFDRRRRLIRVAFPRGTAMLRSSATSSWPALPLYSAGTSTTGTPEQRQKRVAALVSEIEEEAAARRERTGVQPLGPVAILAQNPHSQPAKTKRSPAPAVHAATQAVRRELRNAYFSFVAAYRSAAEKLRAGNRNQPFPTGCFPPALPFVGG